MKAESREKEIVAEDVEAGNGEGLAVRRAGTTWAGAQGTQDRIEDGRAAGLEAGEEVEAEAEEGGLGKENSSPWDQNLMQEPC